MSVIIRAAIDLERGCRLLYDCPLRGESFDANNFFDKYRGKFAFFEAHCEELVGVLDHKGRPPGRYVDPGVIHVRFKGETESRDLNIHHFVVIDPLWSHVATPSDAKRLSDLLHPVLFYPGDKVRLKKQLNLFSDEVHEVGSVFIDDGRFAPGGVPRYQVFESDEEMQRRITKLKEENDKLLAKSRMLLASLGLTRFGRNIAGENIELISRGNVWALYNDSSRLSFKSDEDENDFWSTDGICRYLSDEEESRLLGKPLQMFISHKLSLEEAYRLCKQEDADIIVKELHTNRGEPVRYQPKKLHRPFEEHVQRVARLTDRLWAEKAKQTDAA